MARGSGYKSTSLLTLNTSTSELSLATIGGVKCVALLKYVPVHMDVKLHLMAYAVFAQLILKIALNQLQTQTTYFDIWFMYI